MPNFIHSFDAAHIVLITTKISESYKFNIVTIHDCFGTHANYAELLSEIIKERFIAMYLDKQCINDFHNHILNSIKLNYTLNNNKVMDSKGREKIIPEKPQMGELDISKILPYSSTFTS
jgi:DNA-directed RNA polymerase